MVDGIAHFLSATAGEHLRRLSERFELVWCTGWEEKANEYLPLALGLPGPLPHLVFDPADRPTARPLEARGDRPPRPGEPAAGLDRRRPRRRLPDVGGRPGGSDVAYHHRPGDRPDRGRGRPPAGLGGRPNLRARCRRPEPRPRARRAPLILFLGGCRHGEHRRQSGRGREPALAGVVRAEHVA